MMISYCAAALDAAFIVNGTDDIAPTERKIAVEGLINIAQHFLDEAGSAVEMIEREKR